MRTIFASLALALSFAVAHAQTEEQRKYVFAALTDTVTTTLEGSGQLGGLSIQKHSTFEYMDLYLDTDELDLAKRQLSLRIRRRDYGNGTIEYGMQLKSEMAAVGDVRMEIDEDELGIQRIYSRGRVLRLEAVLEDLFLRFQEALKTGSADAITQQPEVQDSIEMLREWLAFKADSPIAPLQKLRHLKLPLAKRQSLRPQIIGRSLRSRSHVFIDRQHTDPDLAQFAPSQRDSAGTPERLRGPRYVWTMEASFDRALFVNLLGPGVHEISEFEVENKYLPHAHGSPLLARFEDGLTTTLGAQVNLDSKYLQTMKALGRVTH